MDRRHCEIWVNGRLHSRNTITVARLMRNQLERAGWECRDFCEIGLMIFFSPEIIVGE